MEKKNSMFQATHSTEYDTEKMLPELVELSENELQQIVGGSGGDSTTVVKVKVKLKVKVVKK